MTTYVRFVTALGALTITGVKRTYGYGETPPRALNAGELPAAWVQLPEGETRAIVFTDGASWPQLKAQLIVAVLPTAQSTFAEAFEDTVIMMDAMCTALKGSNLALSKTTWSIRQGIVSANKVDYWAVIADVSANG